MYIGEKMSIATEILAMKFSKNMFNKSEFKTLLNERRLVYLGDEKTIDKIINIYGKELKEEMKKNG